MSDAPVAAIDCGTNTVKLLVTTSDRPDGELAREARMVRLGQGVDRSGRLSDDALSRTFAAVEEFAATLDEHGVPRDPSSVRFCATSATRDASNSEEFGDGVLARLGVRPEVLSGAEEAALSFDGAVRLLRRPPSGPVLVVDVGGGSTELVLGTADEGSRRLDLIRADSMDVGSVRLHERHLASDPPTRDEVAACVSAIDSALAGCPVEVAEATAMVGVAGTVTTLAAGVLDLPAYDRDAIDQQVLDVADVDALVDRLVSMTVDERLELPWMAAGRADVIGAGALIVSRVLRHAGVSTMTVSESDILDAIAWSLLDAR